MSGLNGYIFYSNKCQYCTNLRNVMRGQNILGMFKENCIENMKEEEIIKMGLSVVPTIVIISQNTSGKPTKGIYEKDQAFKYIEGIIANRRACSMNQAENSRKLIQMNNIKRNVQDGLYEYQKMEVEGFSDAYSYFNNDQSKESDIYQPKSFLPHGKDKAYSIMTIPESKDDIQRNKLTKKDQDKMIANLTNVRENQDVQLKDIMGKEQLERVIETQIKAQLKEQN
jgi:hypothetical protein